MKRTEENSTHENIVDQTIREIFCYKFNHSKERWAILFYIFTFGIMYIISLYYPKIFIYLSCDPSEIHEADYCIISDNDGMEYLSEIQRLNFFNKNKIFEGLNLTFRKEDLKYSKYIGDEYQNKSESNLVIEYRNNKYIYIEIGNVFTSIRNEYINFTNNEIHRMFSQGINSVVQYNYCLNKFGYNSIEFESKSLFNIFILHVKQPLYIYQFFSIGYYFWIGYYQFGIIVLVIILIIQYMDSYQVYTNYRRILSFSLDLPSRIKRILNLETNQLILKQEKLNSSSMYIVPGDIIEIMNGDIMPCDAIILEGYCNVNESDLTGESNLIMKNPLIKNDEFFSFSKRKSILYNGTIIKKCESTNSEGKILALVINTGFNTLRGNMIQNLLFPNQTNFKFLTNLNLYLSCLIFIFIISIGLSIYIYNHDYSSILLISCPGLGHNPPVNWGKLQLVNKIIKILTVIIPPSLQISMTFISFYFNLNLKKKKISTLSDDRMRAIGKVNIFVLDKTGTLTEEKLELFGFQISRLYHDNNSNLFFDVIEKDSELINNVHKDFWNIYCKNPHDKTFSNYKTNLENNAIFFLECLATCHTIENISGETIGNSIDKRIFDNIDWNLNKSGINNDLELQYDIWPKHSYKITEGLSFNSNFNKNNYRRYKLTTIKRYEFSSKFQSTSVIVRNNLDESYRFFIKGAPEKIIQICNKSSIPDEFSEELTNHTQHGLRVIACATKPLTELQLNKKLDDREEFENNLIFLGFIVFKNKLKRDTKQVIKELINANLNIIMATGDNPFTSISVAQECGLISNKSEIIFCNLESNKDGNESLKWYEVNIKKSNFFHKPSRVIPRNTIKPLIDKTHDNTVGKLIDRDYDKMNADLSRNPFLNNNETQLPYKKTIKNFETRKRFINESSRIEILNFIKNFNKKQNLSICLTGKAFEYFLKFFQEEKVLKENLFNITQSKIISDEDNSNLFLSLAEILVDKCKVFARMQPNNKVELINFLKENKENVVGMCGDGANDCGALLSSDIGISICNKKSKNNNITSHFYSESDSIKCIEILLKNGRACYENSVIISKFLIMYGIILNSSCLILFLNGFSDFSYPQYFFIDFFTVLITGLCASKTGACYKLQTFSFSSNTLHKKIIFSILGQTIIQISFQIAFFQLIIKRIDYCLKNEIKETNLNSINIQSSFMFLFTLIQYLSVLFAYNYSSKHRKKFYQNKLYIFYMNLLILFIVSRFLTDNYFLVKLTVLAPSTIGNEENNEINRLILFLFCFINNFFTQGYEILLEKINFTN